MADEAQFTIRVIDGGSEASSSQTPTRSSWSSTPNRDDWSPTTGPRYDSHERLRSSQIPPPIKLSAREQLTDDTPIKVAKRYQIADEDVLAGATHIRYRPPKPARGVGTGRGNAGKGETLFDVLGKLTPVVTLVTGALDIFGHMLQNSVNELQVAMSSFTRYILLGKEPGDVRRQMLAKEEQRIQRDKVLAPAIGTTGGATLGGIAGGIAGSLIAPGIGTAIGAAIGAAIGGSAGYLTGRAATNRAEKALVREKENLERQAALLDRAEMVGRYSGSTAQAVAQYKIGEQQRQILEANALGPQLAENVRLQNQLATKEAQRNILDKKLEVEDQRKNIQLQIDSITAITKEMRAQKEQEVRDQADRELKYASTEKEKNEIRKSMNRKLQIIADNTKPVSLTTPLEELLKGPKLPEMAPERKRRQRQRDNLDKTRMVLPVFKP